MSRTPSPRGDIGLMRAMADADGLRPTATALLARAETWRPWRAYAAQHLWAAYADAPRPALARKTVPRPAAEALAVHA